jgi:class 3 adenylate cyclase
VEIAPVEIAPGLAEVVNVLDSTGWAAEVTDAEWRVVWASNEMRLVLRAERYRELGVGNHYLESRKATTIDSVQEDSGREWVRLHAPYIMHDTGVSVQELRRIVNPSYASALDGVGPLPPPARWTFRLELKQLGAVRGLGSRVVDDDGRLLGHAFLYGSTLPASLLAFIARGDTPHFERMAELIEPGRRNAAVLFADVEGSTDRSRRLPSARYFDAMRRLNTAIDAAILEQGGIVGKHAGDGVSAFFLAAQVGSISSAARAAIIAARLIRDAVAGLEGDWRINIGVHWGATLYMGQIATSGRLEVTALGDEVNECARVQEAARGGQLIASKPLLERLDADDAAALEIDPAAIEYCLVSELPGANEKTRRDAPSLAVAEL